MPRAGFSIIALLVAFNAAAAESCSEELFVGECKLVHGRLNLYNGLPRAVLWPVGTKRLLGVPGDREESPLVPKEVLSKLSSKNVVFADFTVCPLSQEKPGQMQWVCITAASRVVIRGRATETPNSNSTRPPPAAGEQVRWAS